ncbi:hypothetical protein HanIR_Chr16g0834611 [Helianthus annuus]|nr:hypothetical protein HanIR_Chr16g0834611 [Helianthus annuus]
MKWLTLRSDHLIIKLFRKILDFCISSQLTWKSLTKRLTKKKKKKKKKTNNKELKQCSITNK